MIDYMYATLFKRLPLYTIILGLIACTEAPPDKPGFSAYGKPINYLQQKPIIFPDFSLRYLGDLKTHDANQIAYDADYNHQFEVTNDSETIRVTWSDYNNTKHYERFSIGNKPYYLRMKSSYFQNRQLNPGELVVLNRTQFQEQAPPTFRSGTSQEVTTLFNQYLAYQKALQSNNWNLIKTFLSTNRQVILDRSKIRAHMSEQEIISQLTTSTQSSGILTAQSAVLSPMEAKLHLTTQSIQDTKIIGVTFTNQANSWKIERVTVMADDDIGKQWVRLFLNQK